MSGLPRPVSGSGRSGTDAMFRKIYYPYSEDIAIPTDQPPHTEEGDLTMIQQQIAQVQSIRLESERKDSVINELKQQVAELLKYKEQSLNLRAQLALFEERAKLRETESSFKMTEMRERLNQMESSEVHLKGEKTRLEDLLARSEDSKSQLIQQLRRQQFEVEGSVRVESERWISMKSKLEADLKIALDTVDSQRETISRMNVQLKALREQHEVAGMAHAQRDLLEQEKSHLHNTMLSQQAQIASLQDKIERLTRQAEAVDDYRRELENIPSLQTEIRSLTVSRNEMAEQLASEKLAAKNIEEEKRRWKDLYQETEKRMRETNQQLELQLLELRGQLVSYSSPVKELNDRKQQVELLTEELSRQRATIGKLSTELMDIREQYLDASRILEAVMVEIPIELASVQKLLEHAKVAGQLDANEVPAQPLSSLLGSLKTAIYAVRMRAIEICTEFVNTKEANRVLVMKVEGQEKQTKSIGVEIDEKSRAYYELQQDHNRISQHMKNLEKDYEQSQQK